MVSELKYFSTRESTKFCLHYTQQYPEFKVFILREKTEPFDGGQLGLLGLDVVPQRLDQLLLCVDQVCHLA